MKRSEKDAHYAAHLPEVLRYHQVMLADGARNRMLSAAIAASVTPETSFLDVGAGTGVWAILAAKLGAKRVVAVESEECLIPVIFKHAVENGVGDRIEIIHARSNDAKIKGKFDVIVAELFGGNALGEESIRALIDVRERFLGPNGILIPQGISMFAVPARIESPIEELPADVNVQLGFFKELKRNYGQDFPLYVRNRIHFLADPVPLVDVDLRTVLEPPSLKELAAVWTVRNIRDANGIVSFSRSQFTESIHLAAFSSSSWGVTVNEFEPFDVEQGELKFSVTFEDQNSNWTVSVPSHPSIRSQTFSPVFAFTRAKLAHKSAVFKQYRAKSK